MAYTHPSKSKLTGSLNSSHVTYYKLPPNFLSQSIESITKSGALSTATVTAVGASDSVAITGGTNTSNLRFNGVIFTNNRLIHKLKLKVTALGTNPLVGIQNLNHPGTEDTNFSLKNMYANLSTGVVTRQLNSGGTIVNSIVANYNSGGTFVSVGNIIEATYEIDAYTGKESFSIRNLNTGAFIGGVFSSTILGDNNTEGFSSSVKNASIMLADGTYTILDFTISSMIPEYPKVAIIGDSVGIGFDIPASQGITKQLTDALPYNVSQNCGLGQYIYSIAASNIQDVLLQHPQTVLCFFYLSLYYGEFIVGNPNNAAYMTAFNATMKSIFAAGGVPILIKPPSWPLDNGNTPAWNAFVDTQVIAYPGMLVLDLTDTTPTYDSSGFHPSGAYYTVITNRILELLSSNGLLS